jgi:Na+-transporting NADH:ubiquinone oxidoreductase subunit NqrE
MSRWLSVALLVAIPCLLVLVAYDAVAILLVKRNEYSLIPAPDLARGALQDIGLAIVYAITVTRRVAVVSDYPASTRGLCLIMLGLGLAWYEVRCAESGTSRAAGVGHGLGRAGSYSRCCLCPGMWNG